MATRGGYSAALCAAPGLVLLALSALGEVSAIAAHLAALLWAPAVAAAIVLLVPAFLGALRKKRAMATPVVGAVLMLLGLLTLGHVVMGVPTYVKTRAATAMDALEDFKRRNGAYPDARTAADLPEALASAVRASGCVLYQRMSDGSYSMTCRGVLFTKCTFESKGGRWYSWD